MALYESLARAYDGLFPPAEAARSFLGAPAASGAGKPASRFAADLGCATGAHVAMLARLGWQALGLDPSESMIRAARERHGGLAGASFAIGGMLDVDRRAPDGGYGLVLCIGNTLPHLGGRDELGAFFGKAASVMAPGGRLVLQVLNYESILRRRPASMPDIHADGWTFRRSYRYRNDGLLDFLTELSSADETLSDGTALMPFTVGDILSASGARGFSAEGMYSSWQGDQYDEATSFVALIDLHRRESLKP
ncbi:MAG: hypothetical protein CVV51_08120 [Spirochaetae bacterium HGW-Spirochaetae-7]|jgi:SAM-dependent methyltransferase|nr:MAG: hypothetical protein CVV51_08120 [Spirochaetae bacterium HGW-Spirochaetae-7]